ncbi:hypothetical protein V8G54_030159, partial [Vigna mungo]
MVEIQLLKKGTSFSDAEDIVDDFECEALRKHVVNTHGSYSRKVRRFISKSNPVVYRLRMAHYIQDINLKKLPDWLITLIYLKILIICNCPNLLSLPDNMHQLTNLEKLDMTGCHELWRRFKPGIGQDE